MDSTALRAASSDIIMIGRKNGNRLAALVCRRLGGETVAAARGECMRILCGISDTCDVPTRTSIADGMLKCFEAASETETNKTCALEYLVAASDRRTVPIIYRMLDGDKTSKLFALARLPKLRDPGCATRVMPLFTQNYGTSDKALAVAALKCLVEDNNPAAVVPLMGILRKDWKLAVCANEVVAALDVLQPKIGSQTYKALVDADVAEMQRLQELAAAQARAEQERRERDEQARQEAERVRLAEVASARKGCGDWMKADLRGQYTAFCHRFQERVSDELFKASFKNSFPQLKRTPDDMLNPVLATLTVAFNNDFRYEGVSGGQVYLKFKYNENQDGWELAEGKLNDENGLAVPLGSAIQNICSDVCLEVGRAYRDRGRN